MDDLRDNFAYYPGFLSAFNFLSSAQNIQVAAEDLREDPEATEAFLSYQEANHQRQQGSGQANSVKQIWNITGKEDLDDMLSVLRWRLMRLESQADVEKTSEHWKSMDQEQLQTHLERFETDRYKIGEEFQIVEVEWMAVSGMSEADVKKTAAAELKARNKEASEYTLKMEGVIAWEKHEPRLETLAARRDAVTTVVARLDSLRLQLERISRGKGIETEVLLETIRLAKEDDRKFKGFLEKNAKRSRASQLEYEEWDSDATEDDLDGASDSVSVAQTDQVGPLTLENGEQVDKGTQIDNAALLTQETTGTVNELAANLEKTVIEAVMRWGRERENSKPQR